MSTRELQIITAPGNLYLNPTNLALDGYGATYLGETKAGVKILYDTSHLDVTVHERGKELQFPIELACNVFISFVLLRTNNTIRALSTGNAGRFNSGKVQIPGSMAFGSQRTTFKVLWVPIDSAGAGGTNQQDLCWLARKGSMASPQGQGISLKSDDLVVTPIVLTCYPDLDKTSDDRTFVQGKLSSISL